MDQEQLLSFVYYFAVYALPVLLAIGIMVGRRRRAWSHNRYVLDDNIKAGLMEPPSLHPLIDETKCIGCGVCVPACPEGDVLGMIDGKVKLINATQCIGHGQCKAVCPMDAIELVFGTAKRGMDIPTVDENYQTNVDGIYIAGELGGMGLIRNAVKQGRLAVEAIAKRSNLKRAGKYDLVIIGAGPAGITASLTAKHLGLNYVTLEQECLGGSIAHFPRGKIVMTAPFELPGVGQFNFREVSKEELMGVWTRVESETGINVKYKEKMENIVKEGDGFIVRTASGAEYKTSTVLLSIGRRGTPRKLGVPGEEAAAKVVYMLVDAELYRGKHILVVGGGNSALEAAVQLAEEPGTTVSLSHRSESFSRAAKKNREKLKKAQEKGRVNVVLKSSVKEIKDKTVVIDVEGTLSEIPNDVVIVNAGGVLPTPFLKEIGILVETKYGTA